MAEILNNLICEQAFPRDLLTTHQFFKTVMTTYSTFINGNDKDMKIVSG